MISRLLARLAIWYVRRRGWEVVDRDDLLFVYRVLVFSEQYVSISGALRNEARVPSRVRKRLERSYDLMLVRLENAVNQPLDACGAGRVDFAAERERKYHRITADAARRTTGAVLEETAVG